MQTDYLTSLYTIPQAAPPSTGPTLHNSSNPRRTAPHPLTSVEKGTARRQDSLSSLVLPSLPHSSTVKQNTPSSRRNSNTNTPNNNHHNSSLPQPSSLYGTGGLTSMESGGASLATPKASLYDVVLRTVPGGPPPPLQSYGSLASLSSVEVGKEAPRVPRKQKGNKSERKNRSSPSLKKKASDAGGGYSSLYASLPQQQQPQDIAPYPPLLSTVESNSIYEGHLPPPNPTSLYGSSHTPYAPSTKPQTVNPTHPYRQDLYHRSASQQSFTSSEVSSLDSDDDDDDESVLDSSGYDANGLRTVITTNTEGRLVQYFMDREGNYYYYIAVPEAQKGPRPPIPLHHPSSSSSEAPPPPYYISKLKQMELLFRYSLEEEAEWVPSPDWDSLSRVDEAYEEKERRRYHGGEGRKEYERKKQLERRKEEFYILEEPGYGDPRDYYYVPRHYQRRRRRRRHRRHHSNERLESKKSSGLRKYFR